MIENSLKGGALTEINRELNGFREDYMAKEEVQEVFKGAQGKLLKILSGNEGYLMQREDVLKLFSEILTENEASFIYGLSKS